MKGSELFKKEILAQSEDEKIRKVLIKFFSMGAEHNLHTDGIADKNIVAWLERQGEHANFRNKIQVGDKVTRNEAGVLVNLSQLERVAKPTDKVEPKFKIGDWVTDGEYTWKIIDIRRLDYILQSQSGDTVDDTISYVDEQFHLWTIQDAKDGDVLVNNNDIFVFDGILKEKQFPFAYCGIIDGEFNIYDRKSPFTHNVNIYPSTKEQRDLLFQKMKEAGYEWDAEKKELRKIDNYCQENCKGFQEIGKCFADGECKAKRESEQKSAWSEDDEKMMQLIHKYVKASASNFDYENIQIWFRNIKKRVQPHWKPTEEQMNAFYWMKQYPAGEFAKKDILNSLYNDLKKL